MPSARRRYPLKFKVPDFDKDKGTTCPKNHLKMYCWKMGVYAKNEKLLMHFFQESLAGATPFSLVYGMDPVLPFEVEVPS